MYQSMALYLHTLLHVFFNPWIQFIDFYIHIPLTAQMPAAVCSVYQVAAMTIFAKVSKGDTK